MAPSTFAVPASSEMEALSRNRTFESFDVVHVDLSDITANLADGVLVVSARKKARTEPVSITITTEFHKASEVSPDEMTEKA